MVSSIVAAVAALFQAIPGLVRLYEKYLEAKAKRKLRDIENDGRASREEVNQMTRRLDNAQSDTDRRAILRDIAKM